MSMQLCFKDDELWIYEAVKRHSCKSGYIKDVLARDIRQQPAPQIEQRPEKKKCPGFKGV